ncbi:MAG: methionine synthase [Chloroflexaceae bacterium]|nr:methionine synthase [Chloroflexaceae bacterium]
MSAHLPHAPYLIALKERILVFDGAMGTSIDTFHLTVEDYGGPATEGNRDYLVVTRPDVIEQIHASFLEAGCDVIETCTFQSSRLRLEEWGLGDQTVEINYRAASLARQVADRFAAKDGRPRFVAGSIGPTGKLPSSSDPALSDITFDELVAVFEEQGRGLMDGGADVLLIETSQDILEVKAAIVGCKQAIAASSRPVALQVQVTLDTSGRMLLGTDIASALTTIEAMGVDVVGLNCSTGPEHMREPVAYLTSHTTLPVSCIPNAGLPMNVDGNAVYPLEPQPMAAALGEFAQALRVRVVGGCCGSTPEHIRRIAEAVRKGDGEAAGSREPDGTTSPLAPTVLPHVSSAIRAVPLQQDPRPLIIGERVNSLGSRKVKRLLLEDDYESILQIARDQVDYGAHVLDVCVAMTERSDEAEQMVRLVRLLSQSIEAPLMFDSTDAAVLEAALKVYPGRPILNSTSLEGGRGKKIDETLPLAVRYGAAVACMAIDEEGMAHRPEDKLRICRRIYEIATQEYGLPPEALIFDVNTFPITTGQEELRDEARWTIEGIRLVKDYLPGALTSLGVSNLSFGVAPHARAALNSVFLYHAVQAGLDMAMVNPQHITPYAEIPQTERELCEALIWNHHDEALARFIEYYETVDETRRHTQSEKADPMEGMTVDQKIHYLILHRKREGIEPLLDDSLASRMAGGMIQGEAAVSILNTVLLPAMKEVGDRFGAGELILPFVLQSAEVMKRAVSHLERYLERQEGTSKGKVVLATVYGDVHDIGKNLVHTILSNNGYTVYDLGKQVPINTIIEKAIEVQADAIGLSALLVSTSKQMPLCVKELDQRGLHFPVLVGGAAINQQYGHRILFIEDDRPYPCGVFYCKDAFEGLAAMDRLSDPTQRNPFIERILQEAAETLNKPQRGRMVMAEVGRTQGSGRQRSSVSENVPIPVPPFWGARVERRINFNDMFDCLDRNALYRLQWGAKNAKGETWEQFKTEFDERVRRLRREAEQEGWLEPVIAYGYYPVQSDGNAVVVYDPASLVDPTGRQTLSTKLREITRFVFPRQPGRERLCLADYFASVERGIVDVAVFQVVTVGDKITRLCEQWQQEGDYSRAYYLHGLGVSLAEALAEYANRLVRRSFGMSGEQVRRYAWGYPACPDLEDHEKLRLLLPLDAIGVTLTSAYQLVPEQSTAAIVLHHPEAKYFSIGSTLERAVADAEGP